MNEIENERESFDKNMRKNLSKSTLNCDFSNCAAKIEPELEDFAFSYDLQRFRDAQKKLAEELVLNEFSLRNRDNFSTNSVRYLGTSTRTSKQRNESNKIGSPRKL